MTCPLDGLPPEMLLKVFTYLPAAELMRSTRLVCRRFNVLLSNRQWWLARIQSEAGVRLSSFEQDHESFDAAISFADIETETRRWNQWTPQQARCAEGHIGTVDAVRLFEREGGVRRFCLTGSRDRSIRLWDVNAVQKEEQKASWMILGKENAHVGWIWHIDEPLDDNFLSCGWDDYVKDWQIRPDGIEELSNFKAPSAVTRVLRMSGGESVCSTYRREVFVLDTHNSLERIASFAFHRAPVFSMVTEGNFIYTSGEDRCLIQADRRNLSKPVITSRNGNVTVQCISLGNNQLVCGTAAGEVMVRDPNRLSLAHRYQSGIDFGMYHVTHTRGSVIILSRSRQLKVFAAGKQPRVLMESDRFDSDPCRFDYLPEIWPWAAGTARWHSGHGQRTASTELSLSLSLSLSLFLSHLSLSHLSLHLYLFLSLSNI